MITNIFFYVLQQLIQQYTRAFLIKIPFLMLEYSYSYYTWIFRFTVFQNNHNKIVKKTTIVSVIKCHAWFIYGSQNSQFFPVQI